LKLTPKQRTCVILKDVLNHSMAEISEILDLSVPKIKALLHRGRAKIRGLAADADRPPPVLDAGEHRLLQTYVELFNTRNFEGVAKLLSKEVHLDLVGRLHLDGADQVVNNYFSNYSKLHDWFFRVGLVEGAPAILVYDYESPDELRYFLLLEWQDEAVLRIRDYRYSREVVPDAEVFPL